MKLATNQFKRSILEGRVQIGLWSSLGSATASEVLADSGFDWILVDTEHAPNDVQDVLGQLRALRGGSASAVVRPAWNDVVLIKRLLDVGARSLLVPFVQDADQARQAVAAMRYPPRGVRGVGLTTRANRYGRVDSYFTAAEDELCLLVQLESRTALGQLEAIAAVDGVDGIFIGPSDLSADMGHLGDSGHFEVQEAIMDALRRCQHLGKPAGILTAVEGESQRYLRAGFTFVAVGSDIGLLRRASEQLRGRFREMNDDG